METNEYRNETTLAMGVLLCLWLKLDALLEYGMQHVSPFLIATCAVLLLAVAGRALCSPLPTVAVCVPLRAVC